MQATMNLKIKFRESFRPFAPVVLADRVHEWFEMKPGQKSPYMLVVAGVHPKRRVANDASVRGLARLSQRRSEIPAVTHVDDSARIQTVEASKHPRLHALLTRFDALTGCPVLINTSFNIRGEPIVCQPEEAWRCLLATGMDVLVLENFVLRKEDQPSAETCDIEDYVGRFPLD